MISLAQRLKDAFRILLANEDYLIIHAVDPEPAEWLRDQAEMQGIPLALKFDEACAHEYQLLREVDAPMTRSEYFEPSFLENIFQE